MEYREKEENAICVDLKTGKTTYGKYMPNSETIEKSVRTLSDMIREYIKEKGEI